MPLPQEQGFGSQEVQVVVTNSLSPGQIFEMIPGGKPAIYRGSSAVTASESVPQRVAASVDFIVDIDAPTAALAIGDVVDYDIDTKACVAEGAGDFTLGTVTVAKPLNQTRVTVDTSQRIAITT